MAGLGGDYAHIAAYCFVLCSNLWKNKWKQCLHTVHEQAAEPIPCNIYSYMQARLCVETNMHVYHRRIIGFFLIWNAFDTGDECVYVKAKAFST